MAAVVNLKSSLAQSLINPKQKYGEHSDAN